MKKAILIGACVALACGGAGLAIGAAAGVRADPPREPDAVTLTPVRTIPAASAPSAAPSAAIRPAPSAHEERRALEPAAIRVRRLVITRGIEEREPLEPIDTMSLGEHERVYAFLDLVNRGAEGSVVVTFERDGGIAHGQVELEVPAHAGRHRTWAFTRGVRRVGQWRAIVRDHEGAALAEQAFLVE